MGSVLVVGSINVDCVRRLAAPLVPGGRHAILGTVLRPGGGGYITAAVLAHLGHHAMLCGRVADDPLGRRCLGALALAGIGAGAVAIVPGETRPLEILIDPVGERTILAPADAEASPLDDLPPLAAYDLVYVNARRLGPRARAALSGAPRTVAQLPLDSDELRPARVLLAGLSDFPGLDPAAIRALAVRATGDGAEPIVVVTDGPRPLHVFAEGGSRALPVPPMAAAPADTTGAGDAFAAGLCDGLLSGLDPEAAVGRAMAVAADVMAARDRIVLGSFAD
jgi:sugar/nucleoside kinase (ribokinase family)